MQEPHADAEMPDGNNSHVAVRALRIVGGSTTTLMGLALMVLPGPGIPLVIIGLGLLAKDIPIAARMHARVLHHSSRVAGGVGGGLKRRFRRKS